MAPLQRVSGVNEAFLLVARFRGATGQIWASGAIPEAHLALQTTHTEQYRRLPPTPVALQ
jgi:hypothetical protein